jgi:hypothetical protein
MTRPRKFTVDYFPHDCVHKTTMYIIEQKYGNDGYAFWFKVLELLGSTDGHYINLNDEMKNEFLQAKTRLSSVDIMAILDTLCKLGAIDPELWSKRVIWSQNFVNNIETVYKNRKVKPPLKPTLNELFPVETPISTNRNPVSTDRNPQSRVEESIVENSKVNKTFLSDSDECRLSDYLFKHILKNNPTAKKPNIQTWAKYIDLMIRVDHRTIEEIKTVIEWCQNDSFWCGNILSTQKLREKFDRLVIKMKSNGVGQKKHNDFEKLKRMTEEYDDQENTVARNAC